MTMLRFVCPNGRGGHGSATFTDWRGEQINFLLSYAYMRNCRLRELPVRTWMLDSGAFTAWTLGQQVDLSEYTRTCLLRMATDPTLTEIIGLDAIGDHAATMRNCEVMRMAGVKAIPTVHFGASSAEVLDLAGYEKIAIGGLVGRSAQQKRAFCDLVFSALWPARIHALGVFSEALLSAYPFHSADCADWINGPTKWGHWKSMPGFKPPRGPSRDLGPEIRHYLDLEARLKYRWRNELGSL